MQLGTGHATAENPSSIGIQPAFSLSIKLGKAARR